MHGVGDELTSTSGASFWSCVRSASAALGSFVVLTCSGCAASQPLASGHGQVPGGAHESSGASSDRHGVHHAPRWRADMVLIRARRSCSRAQVESAKLVVRSRHGPVKLYGPFRLFEADADVSPNGRWLAYTGGSGERIHLVALGSGNDSVIARGNMPKFSYDSRYLALSAPPPTSGPGVWGVLKVYNLRTGSLSKVWPRGPYLGGPFVWAHGSDRLAWAAPYYPAGGGLGMRWFAVAPVRNADHRKLLSVPGKAAFSDPAWAWHDGGLLYWSFSYWHQGKARLMERHLSQRREERLARVRSPRVKGSPVLAAIGSVTLSDFPYSRLFTAVRRQSARRIRLLGRHPLAVPQHFSVNIRGQRVLVAWTAPVGSSGTFCYGVAKWRLGERHVHEVGPGLGAFWVKRHRQGD